ncbi:MAG TPA: hypothetical protein VGD94_15815 [Vicinamibacterales bacterium]
MHFEECAIIASTYGIPSRTHSVLRVGADRETAGTLGDVLTIEHAGSDGLSRVA